MRHGAGNGASTCKVPRQRRHHRVQARRFVQPVRLDISDGIVDGAPVIVARVDECDRSSEPCRVEGTGKAYLRGYDGDFLLSDLEEQAFLAARKPLMHDRAPVEDATEADFDPELLEAFTASIRGRDPARQRQVQRPKRASPTERVAAHGRQAYRGRDPVARHLSAAVVPALRDPGCRGPLPSDPPEARARNQLTIDGPIPRMLDQAMD
jgi:ATP-dependent DNA helicase RecG